MKVRWLGWAGLELESDDQTLVIDALEDAGAVFAPFGERARDALLPEIVPPTRDCAAAALVTHLHRDHADAAAIAMALRPGGCVYEPARGSGSPIENLALAQAEHELAAAQIDRVQVEPWEVTSAGPFEITAIPALDGLGDPQLSWLVRADGVSVLHLGDTMFHGFWWRIVQRFGALDLVLLPANGAVVDFPHRQPSSDLPVAMTPGQAATAARILNARLAMPIHANGYEVAGAYEPTPGAAQRFAELADERGVPTDLPQVGEWLELEASPAEGRAREQSSVAWSPDGSGPVSISAPPRERENPAC